MTTTPYTITDIANNEMYDYSMYTISSRAIPNMYDSLKPVQRLYLYSSIVNSNRDFKKVSAVAGVVSDYGYQHGETSAMSAGQLMAAEWNNNICLIEGRGSFGTRQVQKAGAPRYVYTRLHSNFNKYIKDIDLSPVHPDPEHSPPKFYIPVIPLVLANGTKGIATGFATNILPRSERAIINACKEYLSSGKITKRLPISFPHFKGTTVMDKATGKYMCRGTYKKLGQTKLVISEVPYGYDREGYVAILTALEDQDLIVGFSDDCDDSGFNFSVTLKRNSSAQWSDTEIIKFFKLEKSHVENLTVIDEHDTLREYSDERALIKDFCDFRLGVLQQRIDLKLVEVTELIRWLGVKMEFITAILDDKITFKNKKKDQVGAQVLSLTSAIPDDIDRLLRINIIGLTKEMVDDLKQQVKKTKDELKYWKTTTPDIEFLNDIDTLGSK